LRNFLAFDHLDSQAALGADVNRSLVVFVKWVGGNHHAGAFRIDALLDQYRNEDLRVIYDCALASFVGFKIPQRRPNSFDRLNEFLVSANVRNGGVESGPAKVWQVFGV